MILCSFSFDHYRRASLALRNSHKAAKSPRQVPATMFLVKNKKWIERFLWRFNSGERRSRRAFWVFLFSVFYFSSSCFAESLNAAAVASGEPAAESAGASQDAGVGGKNLDRSKFVEMPSRFMRKPQQKSPDQKLREVSDMYEKHFLREMTKAMRSTVSESGFIQANHAEKIFREQLDGEYVEKWAARGGIGFSDLIYNQLVEKFGAQLGMKAKVEKPKGPLPLDRAKNFQHPGKSKSTLSYRIDVAPDIQGGIPRPGARDVKAPWAGRFGAVTQLTDNQTQVEIEHDNGLKSQVVFKGSLSKLSTGDKVQAGDTLGFLSSEAKSIYWTVETDKTPRPQTVSE